MAEVEIQPINKGDATRYLIAAVLSALLVSHFHATPMQFNKQGELVRQTAVADKGTTQPQQERAQPKLQQASPVGVTVAATQPTETNYANGCSTYDSLFRSYDWNVSVAEAICEAESGGNPYAVSNPRLNYDGVSDYGLMQIHGEAIYSPSANIARAHQKYVSQGWNAWSTYTSGRYLRFL